MTTMKTMKVETFITVKTVSEGNMREHWGSRAGRHKKQKTATALALKPYADCVKLPCHVTLIRISPRPLDDDNLQFSFKAIRDAVADFLIPGLKAGRADNDPRITWGYDQRKEGKEKGFRIELVWEAPAQESVERNGSSMDDLRDSSSRDLS